jgi:hypothetical protein
MNCNPFDEHLSFGKDFLSGPTMSDVVLSEQLCLALSQQTQLLDPKGRIHGMFLTMGEFARLSACQALYTFENEDRDTAIADAKANHITTAEVMHMLRTTMATRRIDS